MLLSAVMTRRGQGQACLGRLASSGQGLLIVAALRVITPTSWLINYRWTCYIPSNHNKWILSQRLLRYAGQLIFYSVTVTTFRQDFITGLIKYRPKEDI